MTIGRAAVILLLAPLVVLVLVDLLVVEAILLLAIGAHRAIDFAFDALHGWRRSVRSVPVARRDMWG